jgi:hypothetical protein
MSYFCQGRDNRQLILWYEAPSRKDRIAHLVRAGVAEEFAFTEVGANYSSLGTVDTITQPSASLS